MKKTKQFKQLLLSDKLEFICEAHNGLSSKIVEEAGFKAIWGSGLSISAQFGLRDNNEASWTQVLDVVEFMADAITIPIMLDGDTGYGNFNNVQRLVKKLERIDVSAVCIEDKQFPKTNSFIAGRKQPLADVDEFCGKIKAGKDAQICDDFSIVARVEAFIAGWGLSEVLYRAESYHEAGADAILIHSALSSPDEILSFVSEWDNRCPVVIVPTKYYSTPTDVFRKNQISMVIWANHVLRAAITAMQNITETLFVEESLVKVEERVAGMSEVFRLQGMASYTEAENIYMPEKRNRATAIVLAASRGFELGDLTIDKPKTMLKIGDLTILEHIIFSYNNANISNILVVRGYCKDEVDVAGAVYVDNDQYDTTGELVTLQKGLAECKGLQNDLIISYGDVIFRKYIIDILLDAKEDFVIVVDTNWEESVNIDRLADYVKCTANYSRFQQNKPVYLQKIYTEINGDEMHGEWMGFLKVSKSSLSIFSEVLDEVLSNNTNSKEKMPYLINCLIERGNNIRAVYTTGNWLDIDSVDDVINAANF